MVSYAESYQLIKKILKFRFLIFLGILLKNKSILKYHQKLT